MLWEGNSVTGVPREGLPRRPGIFSIVHPHLGSKSKGGYLLLLREGITGSLTSLDRVDSSEPREFLSANLPEERTNEKG